MTRNAGGIGYLPVLFITFLLTRLKFLLFVTARLIIYRRFQFKQFTNAVA